MYKSTLHGSEDGSMITLGTTIFSIHNTWRNLHKKNGHQELTGINNTTRRDVHTPRFQQIVAYKEANQPWVIGANEHGDGALGRVLTMVEHKTKDRIPIKQFKKQVRMAYLIALDMEAALYDSEE